MTDLKEAYPEEISTISTLEEVDVCNICLTSFVPKRDGECCIGCNDEMTCCRSCLPEKNTILYNPKGVSSPIKLAFCDFCGATFRDTNTTIYDDNYYECIEEEYGIPKEMLIEKIRDLQNTWFRKDQMLDRIKIMITKLEMEIEDLQEEARYISSLN